MAHRKQTPTGDPVEYLVAAPHPDDAELGMGGTIALLLGRGRTVGVLDLTTGEPTPFGTPAKRKRETVAATEVLGLTTRLNLGMKNRELQPTLENRRRVAEVYRTLRPRVVFIPYWHDAHPDHSAATQLATEARFQAKLTKTDMAGEPYYPERMIYYYCTHLRRSADVSFVVDVSEVMELKRQAVQCYQSQFYEGRGEQAGMVMEYVESHNRYWGMQINRQFGEPFAVMETLAIASPEFVF